MQIVCNGVKTYTNSPYGQTVWQDFMWGNRLRKFIVYNNHKQIVAIGMCKGVHNEMLYEIKVKGVTTITSNLGLIPTLQQHVSAQQGMLEVAKDSVLVVRPAKAVN